MAFGNLNVDIITGSGASSVIVNNGSANVAGFTTGNNLQFLQTGGGIIFDQYPGTSGALLNSTLNDYETGTWTPSVGGSATYGGGNTAQYIKIGSLVYVAGSCQITSIGTGSASQIINLPFAINKNGQGPLGYFGSIGTSVVFMQAFADTNTNTSIQFRGLTSSSSSMSTISSVFQNGARVDFSLTYQASF